MSHQLFDFALVAEDDVILALNNMMRKFETIAADEGDGPEVNQRDPETKEGLRRFGRVLLELRRSVGNRRTKLSDTDMLRTIGVKHVEAGPRSRSHQAVAGAVEAARYRLRERLNGRRPLARLDGQRQIAPAPDTP